MSVQILEATLITGGPRTNRTGRSLSALACIIFRTVVMQFSESHFSSLVYMFLIYLHIQGCGFGRLVSRHAERWA